MGLAYLPDTGVTIVVAPFQALEKNIISRCQEKGIDYIKWVYGESRYASIMVVSADRAASDQFITYAVEGNKAHIESRTSNRSKDKNKTTQRGDKWN